MPFFKRFGDLHKYIVGLRIFVILQNAKYLDVISTYKIGM